MNTEESVLADFENLINAKNIFVSHRWDQDCDFDDYEIVVFSNTSKFQTTVCKNSEAHNLMVSLANQRLEKITKIEKRQNGLLSYNNLFWLIFILVGLASYTYSYDFALSIMITAAVSFISIFYIIDKDNGAIKYKKNCETIANSSSIK